MSVLFSLVLGIPLMLLRAWVISQLWVWFIIPTGITTFIPSLLTIMGVSLIFDMFKGYTGDPDKMMDLEDLFKGFVCSFIYSLVGLGLGALFHAFM